MIYLLFFCYLSATTQSQNFVQCRLINQKSHLGQRFSCILTRLVLSWPKKSSWSEVRSQNDPAYYRALKEKYDSYIKGSELLTIPEAVHAVKTKTIYLLTADVGIRKLIGVSRETMEEALKSLKISPKILTRCTNALWDILLATEEETKKLAGSNLATKSVRLQTEYLGMMRTKVTVHGVPVHIIGDRLGAFFFTVWRYGRSLGNNKQNGDCHWGFYLSGDPD